MNYNEGIPVYKRKIVQLDGKMRLTGKKYFLNWANIFFQLETLNMGIIRKMDLELFFESPKGVVSLLKKNYRTGRIS